MRCDDCLMAYTTGGLVGRFRARRHVARCAACAEELTQFECVWEELSHAPELSTAHRQMWLQAAVQPPLHLRPVLDSPRAAQQLRWALATAAVLLVAAIVLVASRNELPPAEDVALKQPADSVPAEPVESQDLPNLMQLEQSLDELSQELRQLGREAELLDARRDLDRLSTIYQPLGSTTSSSAIPN